MTIPRCCLTGENFATSEQSKELYSGKIQLIRVSCKALAKTEIDPYEENSIVIRTVSRRINSFKLHTHRTGGYAQRTHYD